MVLAKVTLKDLKKIKNVRKHFEDWKTETQKFHNFYFLSPELVHFGKKLWDLTSTAMKTAKKKCLLKVKIIFCTSWEFKVLNFYPNKLKRFT